jgi:hypothetical protein
MGNQIVTASPQEVALPSAAVPGTGPQTMNLINNAGKGWLAVLHGVLTYVATVTTGGITPAFAILDSQGNIVWQSATQTAIAAGSTTQITLGGGIGEFSPGASYDSVPLPNICFIPPGGRMVMTGSPGAATDTFSFFGVVSW